MLAIVALAGEAAHALFRMGGPGLDAFFGDWVYTLLEVTGAALCTWRAAADPRDRGAWAAMAVGLWGWIVGDGLWTFWLNDVANPPFPSVADGAYYASYAGQYVALVLLLRSRLRPLRADLSLDGLVAGLGAAALAAALVFEPIRTATHGSSAAVAFTLAYPVLDLMLLCMVLVAFGLMGWRPGRAWALLGLGLLITSFADAVYSYQEAAGTYQDGAWLDVLWPASMLVIGISAWAPDVQRTVARADWRTLVLPIAGALAAIGVLVAGEVSGVGLTAAGLAGAALVAGLARGGLSISENLRLVAAAHRDAITDGLTGLSNRRAFLEDLDEALAAGTPAAVAIYDLNGFKRYNDSFGHPAGDALLRRLGGAFARSVERHGGAYRLGGDEFCVLLPGAREVTAPLVHRAAAALAERGDGFHITASYGMAVLGEEAPDASSALQLADERMYTQKEAIRTVDRVPAHDVLLQLVSERRGDLRAHIADVAHLAALTCDHLAVGGALRDTVVRAAELHDIGKLAIPDAVLEKPAALDDEELALMRQHTLIGERILRAAPALRRVGALVRASHERWDGGGYPDGLAGEEIPLGARIVAVCDAYDAMTTDRPYRRATGRDAALAELRACSGTQFDPAVVEAFAAALGAADAPALAA